MDPSSHLFQPPLGPLVGGYELEELLGTGAFGIVYRARAVSPTAASWRSSCCGEKRATGSRSRTRRSPWPIPSHLNHPPGLPHLVSADRPLTSAVFRIGGTFPPCRSLALAMSDGAEWLGAADWCGCRSDWAGLGLQRRRRIFVVDGDQDTHIDLLKAA